MHRWHRDYNRASQPPPDVIRDAKGLLCEWFWLFLMVCLFGYVIQWMGWDVDD